jgi:hypothetical protein
VLDDTPRQHEDHIFGSVIGRAKWVKPDEIEDPFQREGWEANMTEFVMSSATSEKGGWTACQVWGFENLNGERRHSRHVVVKKGDEVKRARMVYDFK